MVGSISALYSIVYIESVFRSTDMDDKRIEAKFIILSLILTHDLWQIIDSLYLTLVK